MHLRIPFTHAFSVLNNIFLLLTLIEPTNVITRKMECYVENTCGNFIWQLTIYNQYVIFFSNISLFSCFVHVKVSKISIVFFPQISTNESSQFGRSRDDIDCCVSIKCLGRPISDPILPSLFIQRSRQHIDDGYNQIRKGKVCCHLRFHVLFYEVSTCHFLS